MSRIKRGDHFVPHDRGEIVIPTPRDRPADTAPRPPAESQDQKFRRLWRMIHTRPAKYAGDAEQEMTWLREIGKRLPCGTCREHWIAMIAEMPPDLSSVETYFASTVAFHNRVNERIGKPLMAVDAARAEWITGVSTTN